MYLYCVTPYKNLKSNFIKIGFCNDIKSLNKRYTTYYGKSFRYYYVKINDKKEEKDIHENLRIMGLHIENELFKYYDIYDFYFYVQLLNNFSNEKEDIKRSNIIKENIFEDYKKEHLFNFFIYIFEKKQINKELIIYHIVYKIYNILKIKCN